MTERPVVYFRSQPLQINGLRQRIRMGLFGLDKQLEKELTVIWQSSQLSAVET
jgi:hypothetical protein